MVTRLGVGETVAEQDGVSFDSVFDLLVVELASGLAERPWEPG